MPGLGEFCGYCRLRLNVPNKFKVLRRLSSRLATVMFRGTPCMYKNIVKK